jgi:predicted acylesterase/phospholipase RssA
MQATRFFRSAAGVFQGGGCRAAAFVGAFQESIRRGVSFTEVAGTSAGSIVAALVGAGATPEDLGNAIGELDFKAFLRPTEIQTKRGMVGSIVERFHPNLARLFYDQGFYSSSQIVDWTNAQLNKLLPGVSHPVTFESLPTPTYIVSTDLVRTEPKIWSQKTTPHELVAKAVQSSCAIPIFFQPVEQRYVDGGVLSNLPTDLLPLNAPSFG